MPGSDAGSEFSQISVREKANKQVRSRYLVLMEKIPNTVQESDYLMILEDLKAKLSADSFEHFISIAKKLTETHGTLERFEDTDHFFNTAVLQGWEGNEGDVETDISKAILLQHLACLLEFSGAYSTNFLLSKRNLLVLTWRFGFQKSTFTS